MPSPAADYVDLFVDGKLVFEGKTEHEWESRIDNSSYDDENAYVKSYCINKVQVYKTYYNPPIYKKLLGKTFIDGKNIPKVTAEVKYYYGGILITTESVKIDTDSFEIGTKSVYRNELIKIIIDDKSLRKIKKLEKSMI